MWRALEVADADGFVRSLEGELDAAIGENAAGLSEGQAQRVAVARANFTFSDAIINSL